MDRSAFEEAVVGAAGSPTAERAQTLAFVPPEEGGEGGAVCEAEADGVVDELLVIRAMMEQIIDPNVDIGVRGSGVSIAARVLGDRAAALRTCMDEHPEMSAARRAELEELLGTAEDIERTTKNLGGYMAFQEAMGGAADAVLDSGLAVGGAILTAAGYVLKTLASPILQLE